jgi:hypothetical protein
LERLVDGPRFDTDPLRNVYRAKNLKALYAKNLLFMATPRILAPSTAKLLYATRLNDFWEGMGNAGYYNFGMAIIGFSLPPQDEYARQILHKLVTNPRMNSVGRRVRSPSSTFSQMRQLKHVSANGIVSWIGPVPISAGTALTPIHSTRYLHEATVVANRGSSPIFLFRRFVFALAAFVAVPLILLAAFVIAVDPYYVSGSPEWPGINAYKPHYEQRVLLAKPYQVRRLRPSAVALGSSRVEAGIDPRHKGWVGERVFNFGIPAQNSYGMMLTYFHAQSAGRPLKQLVAGLDFYAYSANFSLLSGFLEQRFAQGGSDDFARFLDERFPNWQPRAASPGTSNSAAPSWDEALYLAVNGDVAVAVAGKFFVSGREHYERKGRVEGRLGGFVPDAWDEEFYLLLHPDVAAAVARGAFLSGYHHYLAAGRAEGRLGGIAPSNWNEAGYLAANAVARTQVMLGMYRSGYQHYAAKGRNEGRLGGLPPANLLERVLLRWPTLNRFMFQAGELFRMVLSDSAVYDSITTILRQSEPTTFDSSGMRVWPGYDGFLSKRGGPGGTFHKSKLGEGDWRPFLERPRLTYCFTNRGAVASMFEPLRFMIRAAHANQTDLRLYIPPEIAPMRQLIAGLGLQSRYEFWLRELVRINEEEAARAGRPPFPLWDFGDVNTITREHLPDYDDHTLMRWYWEHTHYRRSAGDLILDRIFESHDPARRVPADFGVRLTGANIDAQVAHNREGLAAWAAENSELASKIMESAKNPAASRQDEAQCW